MGTVAFHCDRRERVLLRDIFLLGTATIESPCRYLLAGAGRFGPIRVLGGTGGEFLPKSVPARVQCLMGVTRFEIIEPFAAFHAHPRTVGTAERSER